MNLQIFSHLDFPKAIQTFFERLSIPVNYVDFHPTTGKEILVDTYKDNESFQLMKDVYFMGMLDDAAFVGNASKGLNDIESDYDGILVFGVTLHERENGLLPTRSQLSEITRAFNREFYYTPVVVIFKYDHHIAFANTERLKYTQEWREGEKAGKVSLLRDIDIENPHAGHERILKGLKISTSGTSKIDSFSKLYEYWQEVFNVNILNKKFYDELSNWYFWASQNVVFPGEPTMADAHLKNAKLEDLLQEHRATNVIRMLTRLLFVWFIKEKGLIPEELFELSDLQENILKDISPYHQEGMFKEHNKDSVYYKAILQNLFFATLNCPIKADSIDKRTRGFRGDGYGTHRGIDYLMRYKKYFKNPEAFLEKLNEVVPFLNGGLFECLDDKFNNVYIDGFSDNMAKGEQLIVPDYLFFGVEEQADLSEVVGIKNKKYKQAAVKGLINILKSYKFTITENTPIEEDVALDPELLGKVFENLLASYNPETKTTARKQTGSFYTPREIVNYMVDESLIAYLKNAIKDWGGLDDETLDKELHVLTSFDSKVPFTHNPELQREIITALSTCTILDPACGSGAFPMGILQKMVHILQKLDPENKVWKEVQLEKARKESEAAFEIEDKQAREERLLEINEAFDQSINDPDYARKLFLIENCIYGVDIQPIATQISKLRFFISLVVEQKPSDKPANNFNIRPLPNLETKFVAANTLIGLDKPKEGDQLKIGSDNRKIETLKKNLAVTRHKLFSARTKETKLKYRQKDEVLRNAIAEELKENFGWSNEAAQKLSEWDPYDQNASSPFFNSEWMFGIKEGFDVVIGNPPYVQLQANGGDLANIYEKQGYETFARTGDIYGLFYENGIKLLRVNGVLSFITSNKWMRAAYGEKLRAYFAKKNPILLIDLGPNVFETATVDTNILLVQNAKNKNSLFGITLHNHKDLNSKKEYSATNISSETWTILTPEILEIKNKIESVGKPLKSWPININRGILTGLNEAFIISTSEKDELIKRDRKNSDILKPILRGKDVDRYKEDWSDLWLINTHNGVRGSKKRIVIDDYPIIKKRLDEYKNQLIKRLDQGDSPYNLRNCAYLEEFQKPKIIYQEMVQQSCFYYDKAGYFYCNDTARIITGEHLEYLTALLNSKLFFFAVKVYYGGGALGSTGIRMKHTFFEKFPAILPSKKSNLSFFTTLIQFSKENYKDSIVFENVVDGIVFNLYFPDHMKERGIDVLEFVDRDINEVMKGREFEKLSDTEKEQVIEALHAKWSHPDNEVVKRMAQFKEKSPDILKPILES